MTTVKLSQYFTTSPKLCDVVVRFMDNDFTGTILEPGAGQGHLVQLARRAFPGRSVHAVEIDEELAPIP